MRKLKKKLLLFAFLVFSTISVTAAPMSFLPMEDELSSVRRPIYGMSIEDIKPYRQSVPIESEQSLSYHFGSKDVLLCALLLGVYVFFVQKKKQSRGIF